MQSKATSVEEYLAELPAERREALAEIRKVILGHLPKGYKEYIQYGMIGYGVPLETYPEGYLGDGKTPLPYVCLASQKNHIALYMMHIYGDEKLRDWFVTEYKKTGKKLDMGKSCLRFRKLADIPWGLIGEAVGKVGVKEFIEMYRDIDTNRPKNISGKNILVLLWFAISEVLVYIQLLFMHPANSSLLDIEGRVFL